jgi:hypothetical protein
VKSGNGNSGGGGGGAGGAREVEVYRSEVVASTLHPDWEPFDDLGLVRAAQRHHLRWGPRVEGNNSNASPRVEGNTGATTATSSTLVQQLQQQQRQRQQQRETHAKQHLYLSDPPHPPLVPLTLRVHYLEAAAAAAAVVGLYKLKECS